MHGKRISYKSLLIKADKRIYGGLLELDAYDTFIAAINNIKSSRQYVINNVVIDTLLTQISYITTTDQKTVIGVVIPANLTQFIGTMPIIYGAGSKTFTQNITPLNIAASKIDAKSQHDNANNYADPVILKLFV